MIVFGFKVWAKGEAGLKDSQGSIYQASVALGRRMGSVLSAVKQIVANTSSGF